MGNYSDLNKSTMRVLFYTATAFAAFIATQTQAVKLESSTELSEDPQTYLSQLLTVEDAPAKPDAPKPDAPKPEAAKKDEPKKEDGKKADAPKDGAKPEAGKKAPKDGGKPADA